MAAAASALTQLSRTATIQRIDLAGEIGGQRVTAGVPTQDETVTLASDQPSSRLFAVIDMLSLKAGALPRSALYLIPLRIFIGLGWLRAGVEKVIDSGWWTGETMRLFIELQVRNGLALQPFERLLTGTVSNAAVGISAVMALTQLVIGVAITIGWRTGIALVCGIAMNLAYVVAGRTDPNVFYLMIEWALLIGGAGTLLGVDGLRTLPSRSFTADRSPVMWACVTLAALIGALTLVPFVTTVAPSLVIQDPALLLITLALLVAGTATLASLRAYGRRRRRTGIPSS